MILLAAVAAIGAAIANHTTFVLVTLSMLAFAVFMLWIA